jgi:hypothetical protein
MTRGLPLPIMRVRPPARVAEQKLAAVRMRLEPVLAAVTFPAFRWQLVAAAEYQGSDGATREALGDLWAATYPDPAAVVDELAQRSLISRPVDTAPTLLPD